MQRCVCPLAAAAEDQENGRAPGGGGGGGGGVLAHEACVLTTTGCLDTPLGPDARQWVLQGAADWRLLPVLCHRPMLSSSAR